MSERFTGIHLPGCKQHSGLADYGRKTPEEMIEQYRSWAERQKEIAENILSAPADWFRVETYTGIFVQRNVEVLQEGRAGRPSLAEARDA